MSITAEMITTLKTMMTRRNSGKITAMNSIILTRRRIIWRIIGMHTEGKDSDDSGDDLTEETWAIRTQHFIRRTSLAAGGEL